MLSDEGGTRHGRVARTGAFRRSARRLRLRQRGRSEAPFVRRPRPADRAGQSRQGPASGENSTSFSCNGKGKNKTFSILPMDKLAFRISKAKAFSEEAVLKYIEAAYPMNLQNKRPGMAPVIHDEEDMQIPFNASNVQEDKTAEAKELYKECKAKGLHVEPRKSAEYYAKCLKDYAAQADAWGSDDLDNW